MGKPIVIPANAKIIIEPAMSALLRSVKGPVESVDEKGHHLGTFTPLDDKRLHRDVEIPFTDEELRRFDQEEAGRRLAEILADLKWQL
jgi:hypothetical protein